MKWYKLNEDKTFELVADGIYPSEADLNNKRVGDDTVDGQRVSTVFLHFDHNWSLDNTNPVLFETMIFGGEYDQDMWRYCSWNEAKEGHDKIVHCLKHGINPNEAL
jgi:hypothetical protein